MYKAQQNDKSRGLLLPELQKQNPEILMMVSISKQHQVRTKLLYTEISRLSHKIRVALCSRTGSTKRSATVFLNYRQSESTLESSHCLEETMQRIMQTQCHASSFKVKLTVRLNVRGISGFAETLLSTSTCRRMTIDISYH